MITEWIVLMAAAAAAPADPRPQFRCPEAAQAKVATRQLSGLPDEIHRDLRALTNDEITDEDVPLLRTDAPTASETSHATARFVQAMLLGDKWVVQFEVALFAGVRTLTYIRNNFTGPYHRSQSQVFGGPACASLRAVLDGVATPGVF
jgi:hypothetical protein